MEKGAAWTKELLIMLIGDILVNNARWYPDKVGIIDGLTGYRFSWRDVNSRVNRISNALIDLGVRKGDRIGLISENSLQCGEFQFAVSKTGTIGCGLNYRLHADVIKQLIHNTGLKAIFVQSQYCGLINSIRPKLKTVEHFIGIGKNHGYELDYDVLLDSYPEAEVRVDADEDDPLVIAFTTGTTGIPKGVITTHKNRLTFCIENCVFIERYTTDDIVSVSAPWCIGIGGQVQFLAPVFAGATVVIHPLGRTWPEIVERERITIAMMTKSRFMPIWDYIDAAGKMYDLSSLKKVMIGAEHTPPGDLKKIMDFCGVSVSGKSYGITEAGACVTRLLPHDISKGFHPNATKKEKRRIESVGKPLLGTRVKLVDEQHQEVVTGEVGEVIVKGDQVSPGYWNDPDLTKERFRDGWYHTNDLGVFDEDGYLYLKGRKDFVIKTGGVLVPPINVEDAILNHPAVDEVAVIGVPSERWGEAVKAVIALKKDHSLTEEEVKSHCREFLAGFQVPKIVQFVERLPRSAAGRIQTKKVIELYGS